MKKEKKTSDQMRKDTIDALNLFINNLKEYLRKGTYEIEYVDRALYTGEIRGINLHLDDHRLVIRQDNAEVMFYMEMKVENLLNQSPLDDYERLSIDREILNHEEKLKKLKAQKANLAQAALQKIDEDEVGS